LSRASQSPALRRWFRIDRRCALVEAGLKGWNSPDDMASLNVTTDDYRTSWSVMSYLSKAGKFDLVGLTHSLTVPQKLNTIVFSCDAVSNHPTLNVILPYPVSAYSPPFSAISNLVTNASEYIKDVQLISEDEQGNPTGDPFDLYSAGDKPLVYYMANGYLRIIISDLSPKLLTYIERAEVLDFQINMNSAVYWSLGYALELGKESDQIAAMMTCPV
jgi:hypothetical protein